MVLASGVLGRREPCRVLRWDVPEAGLVAHLVLDDLTLGPAAGGIRTWAYSSSEEALADAQQLARAMTLKCALGGLDAGGGKMVVEDHAGLDRPLAFAILGEKIEALEGAFRTGADLGTGTDDILVLSQHTRYAHSAETGLARAVGRGVLRCIEACARVWEEEGVSGLRVHVQGAGSMGSAVATSLVEAGAQVWVSDLDVSAAAVLCEELGIEAISPEESLAREMDVFCPCAVGGVIDEARALSLRARAVCGAANNVLASPEAGVLLQHREVLYVPDTISSAGAVIDGIGRTVMNLADRDALIDALGETAERILREARHTGRCADEIAAERAWARIDEAAG